MWQWCFFFRWKFWLFTYLQIYRSSQVQFMNVVLPPCMQFYASRSLAIWDLYLNVVGNSSGAQRYTLPKHPVIPNLPTIERTFTAANKFVPDLHNSVNQNKWGFSNWHNTQLKIFKFGNWLIEICMIPVSFLMKIVMKSATPAMIWNTKIGHLLPMLLIDAKTYGLE